MGDRNYKSRFLTDPNAILMEVRIYTSKDVTPDDVMTKYNTLCEEAEILLDKSLPNERMLILKHGKQHYSVAVVSNKQFNWISIVPFLSKDYDKVVESFNTYIEVGETKGLVS